MRHGKAAGTNREAKHAAKAAAKAAQEQEKAAERRTRDVQRRENNELAPVGSHLLYMGKTTWGTLDYYATPDGDVWIKKTGTIGRLSDFHVEFEQQTRGAVSRQEKGGKQDGAIAYATVTCGSFVKAHKIETMYAGVGSHVFTNAREAALKANAMAASGNRPDQASNTRIRVTDHASTMRMAPETPSNDAAGLLIKLAELRDAGVLTADEFAAKKAELLAQM